MKIVCSLAAMSVVLLSSTASYGRDRIHIVGSSTVYPFTTTVAENYGRQKGNKAPIVESSGTGGGFKLFCSGLGLSHPDLNNASRPIKKSEFNNCKNSGVTEIVEMKIGYDGLTLTQSKNGPNIQLTMAHVFLALAEYVPDGTGNMVLNPYKLWSDISPNLPKVKIEVLGPPPTSGTRDSFHELFMEKGAEKILSNLKKEDPKRFETAWKSIRQDGAFVEAGENDNVIVQKLASNKNAFGIFGFSFLDENRATMKAVPIDGIEPSFENISSGKYKGSRPLFVYLKKQHVGVIPGLKEFAQEYASKKALSQDGYLARKGLVTLPAKEMQILTDTVSQLTTLTETNIQN